MADYREANHRESEGSVNDRFAAYRRGIETSVMKSATPNVVRDCLEEIERLRAEVTHLAAKAAYYEHYVGCGGGCPECSRLWDAYIAARDEAF